MTTLSMIETAAAGVAVVEEAAMEEGSEEAALQFLQPQPQPLPPLLPLSPSLPSSATEAAEG